MQLSAILTGDDIASVLAQITPLRLAVGATRVITLGRPTKVELVAGQGLRLHGDARVRWDTYGLTVPVTLRSWRLLLAPSLTRRNGRLVLAFDPLLEGLEVESLPTFLAGRIAGAIRGALAAHKDKLSWDLDRHLSLARSLPDKLAPPGELALGPSGGTVTVTATDVRLTLDFALRIRRDPLPVSLSTLATEVEPGARTDAR